MRTLSLFIITCLLVACADVAQGNQEFVRAMTLLNSGNAADAESGRAALEQAAAMGSPDAAITLGYFHLQGTNGFAEDQKKAFTLFEKAARTGHVNAQYNAGLAHLRGVGTSINMKKAYAWFLKAAYQDDPGAQYNTAVMLVNGDGVVADPLAAYAWFTIAEENGHKGAALDKPAARKELRSEDMQQLESVLTEIRAKIRKPAAPTAPEGTVKVNAPL